MEQKFVASLASCDKSLRAADHLAYVTFPLVKENKICLQILSELNISVIYLINAILQYEYYFKRITLFTDPDNNLETFKNECLKLYDFTDHETKAIFEIMRLAKAHKSSPMEFVKDNNVIIMSDSMHTDTVNIDKIKTLMSYLKSAVEKSKKRIRQSRLF